MGSSSGSSSSSSSKSGKKHKHGKHHKHGHGHKHGYGYPGAYGSAYGGHGSSSHGSSGHGAAAYGIPSYTMPDAGAHGAPYGALGAYSPPHGAPPVPYGAPPVPYGASPAPYGSPPIPGAYGAPGPYPGAYSPSGHAQEYYGTPGASPHGAPVYGAPTFGPPGHDASHMPYSTHPGPYGFPPPPGAFPPTGPFDALTHSPYPGFRDAPGMPDPHGAPVPGGHGTPGLDSHGPPLPSAHGIPDPHGAHGIPDPHSSAKPPPAGFRIAVAPEEHFPDSSRLGPPVTKDASGDPIYIGSAIISDHSVHPCKIVPNLKPPCRVPYGGVEYEHKGKFDILPFTPDKMKWVAAEKGKIPSGKRPVEGGIEEHGAKLYHALAKVKHGHDIILVPGKVGEHLGEAKVAFGGAEMSVKEYEILCWRD